MRTAWPGSLAPPARSTVGLSSWMVRSITPLLLSAAGRTDDAGGPSGEGQPEVAGQLPRQLLLDDLHRDGRAELARERGDRLAADTARDHLVAPAQVGVDVQGQPVRRDPALHPDADCGQLALAVHPDPRVALEPCCGDAECGGRVDDGRLERLHVPAQVE